MSPSVRGALRAQVLALLAVVGAATGALVGWAAGVVWLATGLPDATTRAAAVAALATGALDLAGRFAPPSTRRQVPQLWGRVLGPRTVAALYGARLGVGPATILTSWAWWAALLVGAACGPWVGAVVGATFALVRTIVTHVAVAGVTDGGAMAHRVAHLQGAARGAAIVGAVIVGAVASISLLAAESEEAPTARRASRPTTIAPDTVASTTSTIPVTPELRALDDLLLDDTLDGFERDDGALRAGPLDLEAAARLEADVDAERALLETRGFVRGASRGWLGDGDDVVYLAGYEFARGEDAAAYLEDGRETLAARASKPFSVPGVSGAVGFTTEDPGSDPYTTHVVAFVRASRWFLVIVGSADGRRPADDAIAVALRQAAAVS